MSFFPENRDGWLRIGELIDQADTIFITTHVNPDGDAIGSETALARFCLAKHKKIRVINHSPTPEAFRFLDPDRLIESDLDAVQYTIAPREGDIVFFLDLGKFARAGKSAEFLVPTPATKIIIDHHPPEKVDADIIVVNPDGASTGSLLFDLINTVDNSVIDRDIAFAILTAIVTDTGYFRYSNTTSRTHLIAAELYNYGVQSYQIRRHLETGYSFFRQKLLGLALSTLKSAFDGQVCYAHISAEMFKTSGASREHTDGIIDQVRFINDVKIAFLAIQEGPFQYKVSFRSGDIIPVNKVATLLGGGGHFKAAGATVEGTFDEVIEKVLTASESILNAYKSDQPIPDIPNGEY